MYYKKLESLNAPIDVVHLSSLMNSAKKVGTDENIRKINIIGFEKPIYEQIEHFYKKDQIEFLLIGDIIIKGKIECEDLGVFIEENNNPEIHPWLHKYYYNGYLKVNGKTNEETISEAFDRLELALNLISASHCSRELNYYVKFPHLPFYTAANINSEFVNPNLQDLLKNISQLSNKNRQNYIKIISLLRKAQLSNSVFESYLSTWSAFQIACSLYIKLNRLGKVKKQKYDDIINLFKKHKPNSVEEGHRLLYELEEKTDQKQCEKAINYYYKSNPKQANIIIDKCFSREPKEDRLYNIRSKIAHGIIDQIDRRNIWQIAYRLSELNESVPIFSVAAPLNLQVNHKIKNNIENRQMVKVHGFYLDKNCMPQPKKRIEFQILDNHDLNTQNSYLGE